MIFISVEMFVARIESCTMLMLNVEDEGGAGEFAKATF